jgi:hypothetical protein
MIAAHSILTSLWASIVALVVAAISMPLGSFIPLTSEGVIPDITTNPLPFRMIGLAFALKKGFSMDQTTESELSARGFTTMSFNKQTIYLKAPASKDDYTYASTNVTGIDETKQVPNRFLNPAAFRALLILGNLTSIICSALHTACEGEGSQLRGKGPVLMKVSQLKGVEMEVEGESSVQVAKTISSGKTLFNTPDKTDFETGRTDWTGFMLSVFVFLSNTELHYCTPSGVINNVTRKPSFIHSGDTSKITSHGLIGKFVPALAIPDPNIITDVLAKYFMRLLGEDQDEQHELLCELKRGVGLLRLTRLGDELAHLYKCIELSIECRCGMVPFFSGSTYEGSVLMGGEGCRISWPSEDRILEFLKKDDLKLEYKRASGHSIALAEIAEVFPELTRPAVKTVETMMGLRALCLVTQLTADENAFIVSRAADLTFSDEPHWVVNPANIKRAFQLISGEKPLEPNIPITRQCLFSKDPVLLGLSVFGEEGAPSWNIPSGALKSLKGAPPRAPNSREGNYGKSKGGVISDADWVMVVRRTTLKNAVDDFKELARLGGYRTTSSSLARKQGYYTFGADRMIEYWAAMQVAYRTVDSSFVVNTSSADLEKGGKRQADRQSGESAKDRAVKKARF